MKCDLVKDQLMDYVFSELDDPSRGKIDEHLKKCENCSNEVVEFNQTVTVMKKWPQVEPIQKMIFTVQKLNFLDRVKTFWSESMETSRIWRWGFRLSVTAFVLALLFIRADFTYGDGQFSITFGGKENTTRISNSQELVAALKKAQQENLYLTSQLIQDSEIRQRNLYISKMNELSKMMDRQRLTDLRFVGESLNRIDRRNTYQFDRTNSILQGLVLTTGSNNFDNRNK
ncbi:zf-HC2 domain-containing protein [candidate division KSB1 bacterium]|nr:zf-HC2 domain-containing protein [candidate division KSB1 bacterium]